MNTLQAALLSSTVTHFRKNPENISRENVWQYILEKRGDLSILLADDVYGFACDSLFINEIEEEIEPAKYAGVVKGDRIN